jgi:hypothetical protein
MSCARWRSGQGERGSYETFSRASHCSPITHSVGHKMRAKISVIVGVLLMTAFPGPASADENETVVAGVFCQTAEEMGRYIRIAEGGDNQDLLSSAGNLPQLQCQAAAARYHQREEVNQVQGQVLSFRIVKVTIIGFYKNGQLISVEPHDEYVALREVGFDV